MASLLWAYIKCIDVYTCTYILYVDVYVYVIYMYFIYAYTYVYIYICMYIYIYIHRERERDMYGKADARYTREKRSGQKISG